MKKILKARKKNNKGFSLVELIVVIAIMAVLVGILAPQFIKYVNNSKVSTDIKNGQEIASAISASIADGTAPFDSTVTAQTEISNSANKPSAIASIPGVKLTTTNKWYATWNVETGAVKVFIGDGKTNVEVYPDASAYETNKK